MRKERIKTSPVWQISEIKFKEIVLKSHTYKEMLQQLNLDYLSGGNYKTLKARINKEKIDISYLKQRRNKITKENLKKTRTPLEKILVENSSFCRQTMKKRLLEGNFLQEKCSNCGIGNQWNGEPLILQLEHKNGVNNDNRIENLCLLCPNCHSQTKTYAGRKVKKNYRCSECFKTITKNTKTKQCHGCMSRTSRKVESRPSRDELLKLILKKSFVEIGKTYKVTDNAVRKWCKAENLPRTLKEIKEYKDKLLIK